jgi:hypothetical protein
LTTHCQRLGGESTSKNKRKKEKRRNSSSVLNKKKVITSRDKSARVTVIHKGDCHVMICDDINFSAEASDVYFAAFIWPSINAVSVKTSDVTPPNTTEDSTLTIPKEYEDLRAAFSDDEIRSLPSHTPYDLAIDLKEGSKPPMGPLYNLSEAEQKIVHKYIKDMTEKGLIQPSKLPCGAPILFARKKDGSLRLCVDYRKLNDMTVKNVYPLPLIDEMLDRIGTGRIFTSLDAKDAYYLVRIKKGDEWKTAFRTKYGLYEYLIMPFGLSNAPSTFQAHVNREFSDMIDIFLQIYMDDFLIYSEDYETHVQHVRKVLQRVIDSNMKINLKKCKFHTEVVQFLGYEVSTTGVNMLPERVKVIKEWKEPTDVKSLQSFLGFCNFYRAFIPEYSKIAAPLTDLTKKSSVWEWAEKHQKSFDTMKCQFDTADILRHF